MNQPPGGQTGMLQRHHYPHTYSRRCGVPTYITPTILMVARRSGGYAHPPGHSLRHLRRQSVRSLYRPNNNCRFNLRPANVPWKSKTRRDPVHVIVMGWRFNAWVQGRRLRYSMLSPLEECWRFNSIIIVAYYFWSFSKNTCEFNLAVVNGSNIFVLFYTDELL